MTSQRPRIAFLRSSVARAVLLVIGSAVALGLGVLFAAPAGADHVPISDYGYDSAWESNFNFATIVVVDAAGAGDVLTINAGIDACNQLPSQDYCHIVVKSGDYYDLDTYDTEFYINRSKVRITGESDGTTVLHSESTNFFFLGGVSEIIIENLTMLGRDLSNFDSGNGPYIAQGGVLGYGEAMSNIVVRDNFISGLKINVNELVPGNFKNGAYGISFAGTGSTEATAVENVLISNNTVQDMANGHSENISVGGNIKQWSIEGNSISSVTNIGIDAGGGYLQSSDPALDAARFGTITGNTVTNLVEPPSNIDGVGAIYVDGGNHILISGNAVTNAPHSYIVGAEECVVSSDITIINNTSTNALFEDLSVGGYSEVSFVFGDPGCSDSTDDVYGGFGSVTNVTISGNTLNSPNNVRLTSIYPNNDPYPFPDPDPADPNNAYSAFPLQLTYRVSSTTIDQLGVVDGIWEETQITVASTCLAGNGRIDVNMVNTTDTAALYRIELGNLSARQFTIGAEDWGRMRFTGRPDGAISLRILRDGMVIRDKPVQVACDTTPPQVVSPQVRVINACRAGNGYVLFQFANQTASTRSWVIEFEGVPNRSTSAAPWGAAIRGTTGRPDGTYTVLIRSGAQLIPMSVTVDCD